jgi:alpha-L-rhamnosidase
MARSSLVLMLVACAAAADPFVSTTLRCEGSNLLESSAGTRFSLDDLTALNFKWANFHPKRAQSQTAYELTIAEYQKDAEFAALPVIWRSGIVNSTFSSAVFNGEGTLKSNQKYMWAVQYWDSDSRPSEISAPGMFHVALLKDADWDGTKWLGSDDKNMYLSTFTVADPAKVTSAMAFVCGLGYSNVLINGKPTQMLLTTAPWTQNARRNQYAAIDITKMLVAGKNTVQVALGHGWRDRRSFARKDADYASGDLIDKVLRAQIHIDKDIVSKTGDSTWQAAAGPVIYDSVYNGETYDASKEDSMTWSAAVATDGPKGPMTVWAAPAVTTDAATETIAPINITSPKPGMYVIDFGRNLAGVCALSNIKVPKGTNITLRHAEIMQHEHLPDLKTVDPSMIYTGNLRSAKATDVYIAKGGVAESYTPTMTYHGFRFVEVTSTGNALKLDGADAAAIRMIHFHSALAPRTKVHFKSDTLNKIQVCAHALAFVFACIHALCGGMCSHAHHALFALVLTLTPSPRTRTDSRRGRSAVEHDDPPHRLSPARRASWLDGRHGSLRRLDVPQLRLWRVRQEFHAHCRRRAEPRRLPHGHRPVRPLRQPTR